VLLYSPDGAPEPEAMRVATKCPPMTPARAALVGLIDQYALPGYRVTMLEIQKLVYFLQVAGEPLNLEFAKQQYGPYAETLHHVLQRIEGHFIRGCGHRSQQSSIRLIPEALDEAQRVLGEHGFRPADPARAPAGDAAAWPVPVDLFTIEELGGWPAVQARLFADGGVVSRAMAAAPAAKP